MKKKHYTIPVFVPEEACPNRCVFCNQRKIAGVHKSPAISDVKRIIESHLKTIPPAEEIEIGFFGGNFTGIPSEKQEEYLSIARPYIQSGLVKGIRVSTRPDYVHERALELLSRHSVSTVELGAQSLDSEVLRLSGRGHTAADVENASAMLLRAGFKLGLQMMIGLPGDSKEKSLKTARKFVQTGASFTRIYPALVIRDTELASLLNDGKYQPLSLSEAVDWCSELHEFFEAAGVDVIRMGLHPSEGLMDGSEIIAGPFHSAFGELVLTEVWRKKFVPLLENKSGGAVTIFVSPQDINSAAGHKGSNKKILLGVFRCVQFRASPELKRGRFYADIS